VFRTALAFLETSRGGTRGRALRSIGLQPYRRDNLARGPGTLGSRSVYRTGDSGKQCRNRVGNGEPSVSGHTKAGIPNPPSTPE